MIIQLLGQTQRLDPDIVGYMFPVIQGTGYLRYRYPELLRNVSLQRLFHASALSNPFSIPHYTIFFVKYKSAAG